MATPEPTAIAKINHYLSSETVKARFAEIVGERNSGAYISSVMLAVADSETLQQCRADSIYISALRAATLRLSVDPGLGQAYLVPFGGKAVLIVGYKGLQDMAVRTGKYRYINVGPVYEGEVVEESRISGFHSLTGHKSSHDARVIGWIAAFELYAGFAHTMYMTVEEIHQHAEKYSKSYANPKSGWKTDTAMMERKTVLRLLLRKWGYLDPSDVAILNEIENEPDSIEAEFNEEYTDHEPAPTANLHRSEKQNMTELGFETTTKEEKGRPIVPTTLRSFLATKANRYAPYEASDAQRGLMTGLMTEAFAPDKDATKIYHSCLVYLWSVDSSKKMKGEQIKAALDWLNPTKDSGGAYIIDPMAAQELHAVWIAAQKESGQGDLL
jgi:recombination protein RecT